MLNIVTFVCGPMDNNVYLVVNPAGNTCAVIDPGIEPDAVHRHIEAEGLKVELLLLTHGHFDHAFSLGEFKERYPSARVCAHEGDSEFIGRIVETSAMWGVPGATAAPEIDLWLDHNNTLELGDEQISVLHTPGHSPGQVAFVFSNHAIVGDTLFRRGIGRSDLPGSSYAQLRNSILNQLYRLPNETLVYPGHGPLTTIGEEKRENPFVPA